MIIIFKAEGYHMENSIKKERFFSRFPNMKILYF